MVTKSSSWVEAEEPQTVGAKLEAMRQVLRSLERLVLEVSGRVTALEARMTEDRETKREQKSPCEEDWLKEGECVRVVRCDRYYGRTGKVIGRRGKQYWDVRLDDRSGVEVIYKKRSGLARMKDGGLR